MNGKTPISALQELMATRGLPLPIYTEEGFGTSFKCTVRAAGVIAVGHSSSKKSAKHESAKNALEKLGALAKNPKIIILEQSSPYIEKPLKNYVGELNELSSKRGLKYPDYESVTVTITGEFFFKCSFLGKEALGKGMNKKDAKQDAAKNMLQIVKSSEPLVLSSDTYKIIHERSTFNVADREKIIAMYSSLSVNDPKTHSVKSSHIEAVPEINIIEQDSVDELKAKLQHYGIDYTLKELQRNPYLVYLRISGTDLYFMACDERREEATRKVLRDVLEIKKSGCSLLNNNDLLSFK